MTVTVKVDPMALRYGVVIRPDRYEDDTVAYVAEVRELPGCKSHGATVDEALQNLGDALREYLQALSERGIAIPTPAPDSTTVVWTTSVQRPSVSQPGLMAPTFVPVR